jgi:CBS domain-containing protein
MAEHDEILDEEMQHMFLQTEGTKILNADVFMKPVHILQRIAPITVIEGESVEHTLKIMLEKKIGCMLVTKNGKLSGIVTEGDFTRRFLSMKRDAAAVKVEEIMSKKLTTLDENDSIAFCLNAMVIGGFRHIPLTNSENVPVAVISVKDIMNYIVDFFPEEILNLPPTPMHTTFEREGA